MSWLFDVAQILTSTFIFFFWVCVAITAVFTFLLWKRFVYKPKPWHLFNSWRFYFAYFKFYFDTGRGIMYYPTQILFLTGFSATVFKVLSTKWLVLSGIFYGLFLLGLGFCWVFFDLLKCDNEIQNRNNEFMIEVRRWMSGKNI